MLSRSASAKTGGEIEVRKIFVISGEDLVRACFRSQTAVVGERTGQTNGILVELDLDSTNCSVLGFVAGEEQSRAGWSAWETKGKEALACEEVL